MEQLADLDEIVLRCRTILAKTYISESIAAYRAGAYRASIVTTWIAVVFDIIEKLRELAISGDGTAKVVIAEFEGFQERLDRGDNTVIDRALKFERGILEVARDKFGLFDQQQFTDLQRLREDRNRCAHPTFQRMDASYQPPAELARGHIRNAIIHLLQQPPVQGKAVLDELRTRVSSAYFPVDHAKAMASLKESSFARPTEPLTRSFIDQLVFGFFTKGDSYYLSRRAISALKAAVELQRAFAEPRLQQQFRKIFDKVEDANLPGAIICVSEIPECWRALTEPQCDRLRECLLRGPADTIVKVFQFAVKVAGLADAARARIATLTADELAIAIQRNISTEGLDRAVELYTTVRSWGDANAVTDKLILPLLRFFQWHHVEAILRAAAEGRADLRGSNGFSTFMERLESERIVPTDKLTQLAQELGLNNYLPSLRVLPETATASDDIPF